MQHSAFNPHSMYNTQVVVNNTAEVDNSGELHVNFNHSKIDNKTTKETKGKISVYF